MNGSHNVALLFQRIINLKRFLCEIKKNTLLLSKNTLIIYVIVFIFHWKLHNNTQSTVTNYWGIIFSYRT